MSAAVMLWAMLGAGTIMIGGESVEYTEAFSRDVDDDGTPDRISYYDGDRLVATAYDRDGDGRHDTWVTFDEDLRPTREFVDRDLDARPDVVRSIDAEGRAGPEHQAPGVSVAPNTDTAPAVPELSTEQLVDRRFLAALGVSVLGLLLGLVFLRRR